MADHDIPYVATTIATDPRDVYDKFKRAKEIEGFRFILMLTPCPIAWRYDMSQGIEMGKLAIRTGAWILWEKEGDEYRFTGYSKLIGSGKVKPRPIADYLKTQGRFKQLLQDKNKVAEFQRGLDREWAILRARVDFK
jgi:pyruvate ferredoxin oxidoreductase beta subunit